MSNYLLQTGRAGGAGKRLTVKAATLVENRAHVLRADRLERTGDLVDVLPVVTELVLVVVAVVGPLQLTHRELRGETEGAFAHVGLGNQTLEALAGDHEENFVRSRGGGDPSRVAALAVAVGHSGLDDRLDRGDRSVLVDGRGADGLLVDTEGEATVTHELVTADAVLTELERTGGQIEEVFLDIGVVAEDFDLVGGSENLEELAVLAGERLGKHLLAEEGADLVQRLEVHRRVRIDQRERGVDLLHVAGQIAREGLGAVADVLDAGLDQKLEPDVGVDDLEDRLLQRNLGLQVAALEGGASSLDVDAGTSTAEGLELIEVLGRADGIRSDRGVGRERGALGDGATPVRGARLSNRGVGTEAQVGVIDEDRSSDAVRGEGDFLNDGTDDVRAVGEGAAINRVDVGALASENAGDLAHDAVDVFRREILDRGQTDIGCCHSG